jgi:hypothetical protein
VKPKMTYCCEHCGLRHPSRSCHVNARGAREADEADKAAQRLVPPLAGASVEDIRISVAAYIRELQRGQ